MNKASLLLCAALAGTFGFSSLASAQDWRDRDRDGRVERWERREHRQDRREERRERIERREDRAWRHGYNARVYTQPNYVYTQPRYSYNNGHGYNTPRFHRGGYLPHEYRNRGYYVSNWNAYPNLYAPPYGHQWVNVDGNFLLVALATGLIANALIN